MVIYANIVLEFITHKTPPQAGERISIILAWKQYVLNDLASVLW